VALADPQTLTINGTATPLPRTGLTLTEGGFRSGDQTVTLEVQHSAGKRNRHVVKATTSAIVSDPLVPSINTPVSYSAHIVFDSPKQGVTALQLQKLGEALVAWATPTLIGKVIAGES
jgi:predicted regulator of amino acid metabolism with ACT domain